jgi:serine protease Do
VRIDGFTDLAGQENPAREAGLQLQDVVLEVAGKEVETPSALQEAIAFHQPGDVVELIVWRDGKRRNVRVKLGERPASTVAPALASDDEAPAEAGEVHESSLGMDVQDLTPAMRQTLVQRLRLSSASIPQGVYIRDIEPLGAADDAGIQGGGIITQVGEQRVTSLGEYQAAVAALEPGQIVYLRIYYPQGDNQMFRALRVPS